MNWFILEPLVALVSIVLGVLLIGPSEFVQYRNVGGGILIGVGLQLLLRWQRDRELRRLEHLRDLRDAQKSAKKLAKREDSKREELEDQKQIAKSEEGWLGKWEDQQPPSRTGLE
jgi:hypothetical protein